MEFNERYFSLFYNYRNRIFQKDTIENFKRIITETELKTHISNFCV